MIYISLRDMEGHCKFLPVFLQHRMLESDGRLGHWIPEPWLSTMTLSHLSSGLKISQAQLFLSKGEEASLTR